MQDSSYGVPIGTVIVWTLETDPLGLHNDHWLECDGKQFDKSKYPRLYELLGQDYVPNYQGMFLRGRGEQYFSQDNGGAVGTTNTRYRADDLGVIQGDAIREIAGGIGHNSWAGWYSPGDQTVINFKGVKTNNPFYLGDYGLGMTASPIAQTSIHSPTMSNSYTVDWQNALAHYEYSIDFTRDDKGNVTGGTLIKSAPIYPEINFWQATCPLFFAASQVSPVSSEIRPVNKAVRYMIKAK